MALQAMKMEDHAATNGERMIFEARELQKHAVELQKMVNYNSISMLDDEGANFLVQSLDQAMAILMSTKEVLTKTKPNVHLGTMHDGTTLSTHNSHSNLAQLNIPYTLGFKEEGPSSSMGTGDSLLEQADNFGRPSPKRRRTLTTPELVPVIKNDQGAEIPPPDDHSWRKYGQKTILGSLHPRMYYRCSRKGEGCLAQKQVQKLDSDPSLYQVTHLYKHTCKQQASCYGSPSSATAACLRIGENGSLQIGARKIMNPTPAINPHQHAQFLASITKKLHPSPLCIEKPEQNRFEFDFGFPSPDNTVESRCQSSPSTPIIESSINTSRFESSPSSTPVLASPSSVFNDPDPFNLDLDIGIPTQQQNEDWFEAESMEFLLPFQNYEFPYNE